MGLVAYDSSDSETEEQADFQGHLGHLKKPKQVVTKPQPSSSSTSSRSSRPLGHFLLASDYQLKLLSSQRAKAAASGSKKRIFITPNYQDDELDVEKPKKPKIQPSKQRSSLLSKLPRASGSGAATMSSKVQVKAEVKEEPVESKPSTMFMPNSMKNRNVPTIGSKKPKKEVKVEAKEESDDDEPFFSFTTKEEYKEELKTHKIEAGPSRPSRDMIRAEREKIFATPAVLGDEHVYGETRQPDEEESAIAPYGADIEIYNQIAGPSHRLDQRKTSDAGLDIDATAIRTLQGRKRENVEFVEAKVDASLGDIRENLRKSANQKHVSSSMVDPLKAMKKSDPNAHVSKRTHQLKYLVELAKANETRLNQLWSNAKSSSRSTAQKYGW